MDADEENVSEIFEAASTFVATFAHSLDNNTKLKLYGLYKQATIGKCNTTQPSIFYQVDRAKWNAWNELGDLSQFEAKQIYAEVLIEAVPSFKESLEQNTADGKNSGMGIVFSTLIDNKDIDLSEKELQELWWHAKSGHMEEVRNLLEKGEDPNGCDSEQRTALHWAADGGKKDIVELLIQFGGNINAKDADGLTPLHYGVLCEQEETCQFLVEKGAKTDIEDSDGSTPSQLRPSSWTWWQES
eukprot:c14434_g1_i2.p1 GENE.c14434_g1_i2~~c14434_g1_i2.p1  ORF type:complete len:243 (-),score=104.61 c14434_g1_i2:24-752(-)